MKFNIEEASKVSFFLTCNQILYTFYLRKEISHVSKTVGFDFQ